MDETSNRNFKAIREALSELNRDSSKKNQEIKNLNMKISQMENTINNLRAEMFRMLANKPMGPTG